MQSKQGGDRWYYTFLPYNVAGGSTSPMIPLFITEGLGGTVAQVGLVGAISSMASVPANVLWGNLSDTLRKRKIFVLIGFLGMAMALMLMGLSMDMGTYYFANFVLGAIAAAAAPVSTVIILESFTKEEWARRIGDFSKVGGVGWVLGLILGTVWLQLAANDGTTVTAMRGLFITAAALALVSAFLALKWVPEPTSKVERHETLETVPPHNILHFERGRYTPTKVIHILRMSARNLSPKNFPLTLKIYYIVILLAFTGFLTFYTAFPIFLKQELGLSVSEVFLIYLASSVTSALSYSLAGKWTSRFGGKKVQILAFSGRVFLFPSVFLVTVIGFSSLQLLLILCILHSLIGMCWATLSVAGSTIVSNIALKEFKTESLGAYNAMMGVGTIAGSLIGGLLAEFFGYSTAFLSASGFVLSALILLLLTNVEKERKDGAVP